MIAFVVRKKRIARTQWKMMIENYRFAVSFRGISRLGSDFMTCTYLYSSN